MNDILKKILGYIGKGAFLTFIVAFGLVILKFLFHFLFYLIMIFIFLVFQPKTELVYSHEFNIEAFQDNHTYVVSRYSVRNTLEYDFMRKDNSGAYITGILDQNNSRIIETSEEPKIKVYKEETVKFKKLNNWLKEMSSFDEDQKENMTTYRYDIYIPSGSIKKEFKVDLK